VLLLPDEECEYGSRELGMRHESEEVGKEYYEIRENSRMGRPISII
jgi:hypothetical protein